MSKKVRINEEEFANFSEVSSCGSVDSDILSIHQDSTEEDPQEFGEELTDFPPEPYLPNYVTAKDGTEWQVFQSMCPPEGEKDSEDIFKGKAGPSKYAWSRIDERVSSAFRLLFDEHLLQLVKKYTEIEARRDSKVEDWTVSLKELESMIAIMYCRGAFSGKNTSIKELWSRVWGISMIKETMARNRFEEILRYLRFDDKQTRSERLGSDKSGLISEIWEKFMQNCVKCYRPGKNITVDEQLIPCKARYEFDQFMKNKRDKYGLKFWMAVDVATNYVCNALQYLGKDTPGPDEQSMEEYIVLRLMKPFLDSGRNVTTTGYLTSLELAKCLMERKTYLVGAMRGTRGEVPELARQKLKLHSSLIFRDSNSFTLTAYQSMRNKSELVLSSLHESVEVSSVGKKKPESVKFYESTKYGVDIVDDMCRKYTTRAKSRRWPMQVFYNMLDIAVINSWVLYCDVNKNKIDRKAFIRQLIMELTGKGDSKKEEKEEEEISEPVKKRRRCQSGGCRNTTIHSCHECSKRVCGTCTKKVIMECKNCFSQK